jgi:hypothetical protein
MNRAYNKQDSNRGKAAVVRFFDHPAGLDEEVNEITITPVTNNLGEQQAVKEKTKLEGVRTTVRTMSEYTPVTTSVFHNCEALEQDLRDVSQPHCNRLYILEDIGNNWLETIGPHFSIDPSFFARHLRVTRWEGSSTASDAPRLPSSIDHDPGLSFSLSYPELVTFQEEDRKTLLQGEEFKKIGRFFFNSNLYREMTFATLEDSDSSVPWVGIIRKKVTFWSRIDKKLGNGMVSK